MNEIEALQEFIVRFQVLFVSFGVPLLTVLISWFVSVQTNRTSRKLAEKERALSVQMKLAEFRQEWINGLREDLAVYAAVTLPTVSGLPSEENSAQIMTLGSRIMMRMNPEDPEMAELKAAFARSLPTSEEEIAEAKSGKSIVFIGQRILKKEWDRLKIDLKSIDRAISP